jgi:modulator of FtsH protease HflC
MRMGKPILLSVLAVLVIIVLKASLFVVPTPYHAIVTQFGRVVSVKKEPGLYFKTPLIQAVKLFDSRLLKWDGEPSDLLTVDKENIEVNTWARWRITDVRRFYEALRTENGGQSVLDGIIESSVKNVISARPLVEVLRNSNRRLTYTSQELEEAEAAKRIVVEVGRGKIVDEIMTVAKVKVEKEEEFGFELQGVGIKHFNYVRAVIPNIYERMRSERERIAERYRSEGREREAMILGEMQKELETIESTGEKEATIIRGKADAEVVRIYAEAFEKDPEFFFFTRSLEILPEVLGKETRIVLGAEDSDLFRVLKSYRKPD